MTCGTLRKKALESLFSFENSLYLKNPTSIDFSVAHSFLPNLKKSELLRFCPLRTIFTFFIHLKKNYYHLFLFFHSCKRKLLFSWLFLLFMFYIFLQHFPALAFYLPLLLLPTNDLHQFFIYHDSLLYFILGWFCTYCFWPLPWFSYFYFSQFPGCFVLVFYHDSLFTFFFGGGDFVLTVFLTFTLIFLLLLFSIVWLFFVLSLFLSFSNGFFYFYFLNFRVVWQVAFTV